MFVPYNKQKYHWVPSSGICLSSVVLRCTTTLWHRLRHPLATGTDAL